MLLKPWIIAPCSPEPSITNDLFNVILLLSISTVFCPWPTTILPPLLSEPLILIWLLPSPKVISSFNSTLIALFSASAVTVILSSPANFNVSLPVSFSPFGLTLISLSPTFAVQPAFTFLSTAFNWLTFTASFSLIPLATFVIVVPFVPANATVLLFSLYLTAFSPTSDKLYFLLLSALATISPSLWTVPSLATLNTVSLSLLVIEIMLSFCGFPFNWIRVPDSSPNVILSFNVTL